MFWLSEHTPMLMVGFLRKSGEMMVKQDTNEEPESIDKRVCKHYKKLSVDVNESLETCLTILYVLYQSIIADINEGGAEIRIVDDLLNKKHPLQVIFPLHNGEKLQYVQKEWISIWS
eukprot:48441_1